ncbi:MAG: response regulator [Sulfuricella sp.]|nr:response regulator [Sulfuricella sp.]
MSLKNMPIFGRLSLGFAAMLTMACLMGGLALYNIRTLADLADRMYRHPLAVINNVHSAKEGILAIRQEMNHLLHASPAEAEEIKQKVEDYEIRIANNMGVIRKQYLGPIDDVDAIDGLLTSWWYERAEIFRLAQSGKGREAFILLHDTDARRAPLLDERIGRIQNFAVNRAAWFNHEAHRTWESMSTVTIALMLGLLLVGGLGAWLITRGIVHPLNTLRAAMSRLAGGDLSTPVPLTERTDEVGDMARAVAVFKAEGHKAEALRWVRSNVSELSAAMRVADTMEELAEHLLTRLMALLDGASGRFYLFHPESDRLDAIAHFARVPGAPESFARGAGSVGQCAAERRPIFLTDLPPAQYAIATGMGEALPASVVAYPVVWAEQLLAVIEVAAFHAFDDSRLALLDALMPAIGVNMEVLNRSLRTRELLEQTQHQAEELRASEEELQAQSEELRESNELLQHQTEQLRASEEELKVQSEELQNSYDELTKKATLLQERENALDEARQVAEKRAVELDMASRYKSEFLANMSHELRTPLNSMLILAQSLASNEEDNLSEDQIESARIIHEGGTHLLSLINDILDLSKIEAGKLDLLPEDIVTSDITQSLERRFRHMAQAKGVVFSTALGAEVPAAFRADRRKVEQILSNLVGNALKFTERGEVSVAFACPSAGMLTIAVGDSGVGIAAAKLDKIFDAFEQADGSTSRRFGGTGLGLAISRKLARLMGGDISVTSAEGQGSTFTVSLPLPGAMAVPQGAAPQQPSPMPPTQPAKVVPDAPPPTGEATLLVIEDDPAFARIVCDLARKKGFQCLAAANGEEGLALAARRQPTGIILDIGLPGQDGWSVMERLKRDPATSKIPVHFMSAFDESLRGLGMGAVGFYVKPVTREQIEGAFEKINRFARHAPQKVLVLDKDDHARQAVADLIGNRDVTILEAQSCADALEILRNGEVDCLIFDLSFPDKGDLEFLEKLSAEKGARMPPVVIYSEHELDEEEVLKLRSYTDSIIIKGQRSPERLLDEVSLFLHRVGNGLPAHRQPAPEESGALSDAETQLAGHKVLVVDDDMRNTFALSKVLRGKGLKVLMAQDGDKALAQLEANPDMEIVLMDIMMPGKDGYQTTREIRAIPAWRNIPILALTARAMPGDREKCLAAGASDYLTKPVDIDKLLSVMRVWLKGNA